MNKKENKAVAYSLLSHIRNSGTLITGPIDYFLPLVKRALNSLNSSGKRGGNSIIEISDEVYKMFSLEIPIPVLSNILKKVEIEENTNGNEYFKLYNDNSYQLKDYHFYEYEQLYQDKSREINELDALFTQFCDINGYKKEHSLVEYIDKNKMSLFKYLNLNLEKNSIKNGAVEAKFIAFFKKIPNVFELIKNIYLGSLISTYLEFEITEYQEDTELLLDTNFVISLLDLNTPESTRTCEKVIDLGNKRGFKISIMDDTIKEIQQLLYKKAENINNSTLIKYVNPEDILNACERRGLNRTDLERLADNVKDILMKRNFNILYVQENLRNRAKHSPEYEALKGVRFNRISALHDATAILYVRDKREKKIKKFEEAKCWFVNNSINNEESNDSFYNDDFIRETIRADELLSILWLSNPEIKKDLNEYEFAEIGLNSMVSISLNSSIPKASVIKELEDNIFKYCEEQITEKDILNLATRITNNQIKNVQEINEIASEGKKDEFVKRIKEESEKQEEVEKERISKLSDIISTFDRKIKTFDSELEAHNQNANALLIENSDLKDEVKILKKKLDDERLEKALKKWRRQPWILLGCYIILLIGLAVYILYEADWKINETSKVIDEIKSKPFFSIIFWLMSLIFSSLILGNFIFKYWNHSNIKAYKEEWSKNNL